MLKIFQKLNILAVKIHRELFLSEINNRETTAANNDTHCERGYSPETPSNFPYHSRLDDMPTWAMIGGDCHLVKLLWLHPYDRLQVTVVWIGLVLG